MSTQKHRDSPEPSETDADDADESVGTPLERREDPELLTGEGEFTGDLNVEGQCYAAMVRSQYGHADIEGIEVATARQHEDVVAVFTATDLEEAGISAEIPVKWDLEVAIAPRYPLLAEDRVRYQGQPIAVVVAETRYAAHDATDLVEVSYNRRETVVDAKRSAEDDDAPTLHEEAPDNVAFDWELGSPVATENAFDSADHVVRLEFENQRLIPNAMEPRACLADTDPESGMTTVHLTSQIPHEHRDYLSSVLDIPEQKLDVVAPNVGGGFGSKINHYPDEALTTFAAVELGRPVKWQATRTEGYATTTHGRDHQTTGEMALSDDGEILGVRYETYANVGGYLATFGSAIPTWMYAGFGLGQYDISNYHCHVIGGFTNTTPVDAYRGAGRPEANYAIERMVDYAARKLDMDPITVRQKNFIPKDDFPHATRSMMLYDSGDYHKSLEKALEEIDYEQTLERRDELREDGRYLGIGIGCYVEASGMGPSELAGRLGSDVGLWESALLRVHQGGGVTAFVGTSGHGQGHETTFAQILADELGVPYGDIEIVEGDTAKVPQGTGTFGSRSVVVGGGALVKCAGKIRDKARTIAAHQLGVSEEDLDFENGVFSVAGESDQSMDIQSVADAAYVAQNIPDDVEPGLEKTAFFDPEDFTFPFGTHAAVVEVDPDTGEIEFEQYVAVDDCGKQINPKIVEGQVHGGVAQGIGQALYEAAEYTDNGTLVSGSMKDYAVPEAVQLPEMEVYETVTPSPHTALGTKGVGEAGTIAAPPTVVNAVVDALQPFDVDHLDMPLTAETVWRAIHESSGGES